MWLQGLNLQSANLAAHEDTVLEIIEDLNGVRAGNPAEVAGFLVGPTHTIFVNKYRSHNKY